MSEHTFNGRFTFGAGAAGAAVQGFSEAATVLLASRSCIPIATDIAPSHSPVSVARCSDSAVEKLSQSIKWSAAERIVVIGAGSAIDVAKMLAHRHGLPLTTIPSVLSCNGFATQTAVVHGDGVAVSRGVTSPDHVVIDPQVLGRAPYRWHLAGIADALSIYTAAHDWRLAAAAGHEPIDPISAAMASAVCEQAFVAANCLPGKSPDDAYSTIAKLLLLSGQITALHGSGRPESGSEHLIARALEQRSRGGKRLWHGESVLLGILLAMELQGRPDGRLRRFAVQLGVGNALLTSGMTARDIAECLLATAQTANSRYSILDEVSPTRAHMEHVVATMLDGLVSPE